MNRLVDAFLVGLLLSALAWSVRGAVAWRATAASAAEARHELATVAEAADQLAAWRSKPALVSEAPTPSQHLLSMVSEAGQRAGIAAGAIKSVEGERDRPVAAGSPGFSQQSLRVQFEAVPLPDLGRFLQHWREANPAWIPAGIELSPGASGNEEAAVKWNCRVVFEHVYLAR